MNVWVVAPAYVSALVAATVAIVSWVQARKAKLSAQEARELARRSAEAAEASVNHAGSLAESAAVHAATADRMMKQATRPQVWVDIRPDDQEAGLLMLYVGNSGASTATDVSVVFKPQLDHLAIPGQGNVFEATTALMNGIKSIVPGRILQWPLGPTNQQIGKSDPSGYSATITSSGPDGQLPDVTYRISPKEYDYNLAVPPGTLYGIAASLKTSTESMTKKIVAAIRESKATTDE